ncbi:UdgX family uracil-DNA binding protein [Qipengyuania sp. DGS5-3]|uniref:UdgX family uracil-DNA binding protein n=1 Tax=Qipengyuania sp. DGS5-3 TaxID=3349632 RepID=UPI0036D3E5F9
MNMVAQLKGAARFTVAMPRSDDFDYWREQARVLVQCDIPPDHVSWTEPGGTQDLFTDTGGVLPEPADAGKLVRAPKRFLALARNAALHSNPQRFALLYGLLWRLQERPGIMQDKADPDVRRLEELDKNVRRDSHKMHAFVRFREVRETAENGSNVEPHYVAWFEPDHHILRANAGFFKRRFANMRWSILTPRGSLHWDTETIREGPPAQRSDAPEGDPTEDLWRTYYASIFNPARLKVSAMLSEMPKKYWKNMPEAALIPELIASAQSREAQMVSAGEREVRERPTSLVDIERGVDTCRDCPIAKCGTRTVMGEGPSGATLMIIGEQPGDQEDLAGRVFVGPAGQVLDAQLQRAGIDRKAAYVTNAVKHFKFVQRGKRRLHQNPTAKEIDTCRWWVEAERAIVKPKLVLALGSSAARSLLGKTVSVKQVRGAPITLQDGSELWVTVHPSYLLRLDGDARAEQEALFAADLAAVKSRLAEVA